MLSTTAEGLFWLGRYVERAENIARLIDAGNRLGELPQIDGEYSNHWAAIMIAAGCREAFPQDLETVSEDQAINFLALARDNPSSIVNCFEYARSNARAQRTSISVGVWSVINRTWRELSALEPNDLRGHRLSLFLTKVWERTALYRGQVEVGMLRGEGYSFARLGQLIERADATLRLIDVQEGRSAPEPERASGTAVSATEKLQWSHVLRAAGATSAYRQTYRASVEREKVLDLLLYNADCPRSVACCTEWMVQHLAIVKSVTGVASSADDALQGFRRDLSRDGINGHSQDDLHGYLTSSINCFADIATKIGEDFGFGPQVLRQEQVQHK